MGPHLLQVQRSNFWWSRSKISWGNTALNLHPNPCKVGYYGKNYGYYGKISRRRCKITSGAQPYKNVFGRSSLAKTAPKMPWFVHYQPHKIQVFMKGVRILGWNLGFFYPKNFNKKKKAIGALAEKIPPHTKWDPPPKSQFPVLSKAGNVDSTRKKK